MLKSLKKCFKKQSHAYLHKSLNLRKDIIANQGSENSIFNELKK